MELGVEEGKKRVVAGWEVLFFQAVPSTQDIARSLNKAVVADTQYKGRGRWGRKWWDKPGDSLLLSIPLEWNAPPGILSLLCALCVGEAIECFGVGTMLKWPNDVLVGDKKIAGVLVEGSCDRYIVGIGVNVNERRFPDDFGKKAISLSIAGGRFVDRMELLEFLLSALRKRVIMGRWVLGEIIQKLAFVGEDVVIGGSRGVFLGIGEQGEAILDTKCGKKRVFSGSLLREEI